MLYDPGINQMYNILKGQ